MASLFGTICCPKDGPLWSQPDMTPGDDWHVTRMRRAQAHVPMPLPGMRIRCPICLGEVFDVYTVTPEPESRVPGAGPLATARRLLRGRPRVRKLETVGGGS